jgi:hypothetical protein
MSDAATVLFAVIGGLAAASWFLSVVEWIGTMTLSAFFFRTGIVVFREKRALPTPAAGVGSRLETETAVCRFPGPSLCLFRYRVRLLGFTLHTPFLVKGSVRWDGIWATVEARIPVFPLAFLASWLLGSTAGGAMLIAQNENFWVGIGVLAIGWLFPLALCLLSIPFEIQRARMAFEEIQVVPSSTRS